MAATAAPRLVSAEIRPTGRGKRALALLVVLGHVPELQFQMLRELGLLAVARVEARRLGPMDEALELVVVSILGRRLLFFFVHQLLELVI